MEFLEQFLNLSLGDLEGEKGYEKTESPNRKVKGAVLAGRIGTTSRILSETDLVQKDHRPCTSPL